MCARASLLSSFAWKFRLLDHWVQFDMELSRSFGRPTRKKNPLKKNRYGNEYIVVLALGFIKTNFIKNRLCYISDRAE